MADVANVSASSGKPGRRTGDGPAERPPEAADDGLVQRLADGEEDAVGLLYDRYGRLTYSLARYLGADERGAANAVREVFVTLWRDPQLFDPRRGELLSWLLAEVHRESIDAIRRRSTRRRRAVYLDGERDGWAVPGGPDPSAASADAGAGRRVRDAIARLPVEQRRALLLAFYGGFTQPEIAVLTGASARAVGSLLFGAMRRLRRLLLPPRWVPADFLGPAR